MLLTFTYTPRIHLRSGKHIYGMRSLQLAECLVTYFLLDSHTSCCQLVDPAKQRLSTRRGERLVLFVQATPLLLLLRSKQLFIRLDPILELGRRPSRIQPYILNALLVVRKLRALEFALC